MELATDTITRTEDGTTRVEAIHPEVYSYPEKYLYFYGGRGGGKSKTAARCVVLLLWEHPNHVALVTRKTFPSLRITAMDDTLKVIEQLGVPGYYHKGEHKFEYDNGSVIYFSPLYISQDWNERLKSLGLNVVWIEEPTECSAQDFNNLFPAVRLPGLHKWFFTFNPPERSDHWLYKNYERQAAKGLARKVHFDLEDNPMLPEDIKEELYDLKHQDEGLYLRFAKGEWGIDVIRRRVWEAVHMGVLQGEAEFWLGGVDFGWSNPSSSHLYGIQENDVYVADEIYKTHLQPEDLAELMLDMLDRNGRDPERTPFVADPEAPEKIAKLKDSGLWIISADKSKGSVTAGITEVRRHTIYVDEEKCPNAWRELTGYVYPEDRQGKPQEEPIKFNNHTPDELRYAVYYFFKKLNKRLGHKAEQAELVKSNW